MGSDLYMEQQNFRPKPDKVEWDKGSIVWSKDYFYDGYTEVYRGLLTPEIEQVLRRQGVKIPPKPGTMVRATMKFSYRREGSKTITFNTDHYNVEQMKVRLREAIADDLGLKPSDITPGPMTWGEA